MVEWNLVSAFLFPCEKEYLTGDIQKLEISVGKWKDPVQVTGTPNDDMGFMGFVSSLQ